MDQTQPLYRLQVVLEGYSEPTYLHVINASFARVATGDRTVEVELPAGLYKIRRTRKNHRGVHQLEGEDVIFSLEKDLEMRFPAVHSQLLP